MTSVGVKICGLTRKHDVRACVSEGADELGFVLGFPSSPRNISIAKAKELFQEVPEGIRKIVVTYEDDHEYLLKVVHELKPDGLQLHGKSSVPPKVGIERKFLQLTKSLEIASETSVEKARRVAAHYHRLHLDSLTENKMGGTGKTHDWTISRMIRDSVRPCPVMLAGGLASDNVKTAIQTVKPDFVDVSSGVETRPGIKDHEKITLFIVNAKAVSI